ncbi:MAG: tetratricopeptide repeat protein [Planctomycetota bacterium]
MPLEKTNRHVNDQEQERGSRSLLTRPLKWLLVCALTLGAFLVANTLYLLANRVADQTDWEFFAVGKTTLPKLFQAMVVSHTFVGIVFAVLMLLFGLLHLPRVWKRHRRRTVFSGLSFVAVGLTLAITGFFIMTVAATRNNEWAWWSHVVCAALAPTLYLIHRGVSFVPLRRVDFTRFSTATAGVFAIIVAGHLFGPRERTLTLEAQIALSKGSESNGPGGKARLVKDYVSSDFAPAGYVPPASPFFPSAATTTTGDYLPSRIITRGDVGTPAQLQADLNEFGFAVNTKIGAETCDRCHQDIVEQWSKSAHRFASFNNPFYEATINDMRKNAGVNNAWIDEHLENFPDAKDRVAMVRSKWCSGCHDPALMLPGDMDDVIDRNTSEAQAGLTCLACHAIDKIHNQTGNGNYNIADEQEDPYLFPTAATGTIAAYLHDLVIKAKPTVHKRQMKKEFFTKSDYCATCHKVNLDVPVNNYRWFRGQNDFDSWHDSGVALNASRTFYLPPKKRECQDCHMPQEPAPLGDVAAKDGKVRSHRFLSVNTALPFVRGDADTIRRAEEFLRDEKLTVDVFAVTPESAAEPIMAVERSEIKLAAGERYTFDIVVRNKGVGHTFPAGTNDSNEGWLEISILDDKGATLAISGAIQPDGHLDPYAHLYKSIMLDHHGERISRRNAQDIHVAAFVRVIGPGTADTAHYAYTPSAELAGRSVTIKARLLWRKFDRPYTEFAYAANRDAFKRFDHCPDLPVTEIASDSVTFHVTNTPSPFPAADPDPKDWMRYNDYGIGLFLQDDTRQAAAAFGKVAQTAAQRLDGPRNLARVAIREGNLALAYQHLKECERLSPGDPQTAWVWGTALQEDGRYEEAVLAYLRVIEVFPDDRSAWRNMGLSHRLNNNYRPAIDALDRVLAIDPEDRVAHYHKIFCLRAVGREEEANTSTEAYEKYQIDESAQELTQAFRLKNPGVNFETQPVHVHELVPTGAQGHVTMTSHTETALPK